jgi:hypothetical protein
MSAIGHDGLGILANQLRYRHRAAVTPGFAERAGELRPAVEGVGTLAGLDLANSRVISKSSAAANRATASRCASRPRHERP